MLKRHANYSAGENHGTSYGMNYGTGDNSGSSSSWGNGMLPGNTSTNKGRSDNWGENRGQSHGTNTSRGYSEQMEYAIEPGDFARCFLTGGRCQQLPDNRRVVSGGPDFQGERNQHVERHLFTKMKPPSLLTRAFGNPVFAVIACGWFVKALGGWYLGHPSLPETLLAGGCVLRSLSAWRTLRNHRAWLRQWNDAGTPPAESSSPASDSASDLRGDRSASKGAVIVSGLLIVLLPLAARSIEHDATTNTLAVLAWLACIVWFPVALVKYRRHGAAPASAAKAVKAEPPAVVAWVSGPASIAPSRADAIRNLPDYALSAMGLERVGR